MTEIGPRVAETVLIRHPCDCPTASRPLGEGEQPEHRFEINGVEFPWHITTDGPTVTKLGDDLYTVRVEIFAHSVDTDGPVQDSP
jgi:hypothetical protein